MTSTPPDPFGPPTSQQPQPQTPASNVPPPSAAPPPPGAPQWNPQHQGFAQDPPRGLGVASLIIAGIVTVLTLAMAGTAAEYVDVVVDRPVDSLDFTAHEILSVLYFLPVLASYVVMSLWAYQANVYGASVGRRQRLHKVWAWFMWWIPLASLVLPIIYAWDFVVAKARAWVVVWWVTWLLSGLAAQVGAIGIGLDGSVDEDFLQLYTPSYAVAAVLTLISFAALVFVVRGVRADENSPA